MQSATDITANNALPARLPKGFELGGYVVDGWLRDGGMAAIYRAHRVLDDHRVAIKLQLPSTAHDPSICARFDREAEVMARANGSPHVVELYDAGVLDDGRRYFVLEWVEGENLEELLDFLRNQDQRLDLKRACRIGRDVARGLAELQEHGVLHLDLKPANVMVAQGDDGGDEIKLVDFGIAADLHEADASDGAPDAAVMGTSGYMCPEQLLGHPPSPAFDVYALGVLMFEALSGNSVPRDGWKPETLPRLESLRRGVPAELAELVRTCMDFDPERRPASAAAVLAELARIIRALESDGGGSRVSSEEIPVRTGGTEIVAHASVSKVAEVVQAPARTGGTEIALTHEEVLLRSGMAVPLTPEVIEAARLQLETRKEQQRVRPRVWWVVLGGVGLLALGGVWLGRSGDDAGQSKEESLKPAKEAVLAPAKQAAPERKAVEPPPVSPVPSVVEDEGSKEAPTRDDGAAEDGGAPAAGVQPPAEPSGAEESPTVTTGASRADGRSAEECRKARAEAIASKGSRTWRKVLKVTSSRGCWTTAGQRLERKQLRVEAYAELGEFGKCVDEGGKIQDKQIEARVKFCRKQVGG